MPDNVRDRLLAHAVLSGEFASIGAPPLRADPLVVADVPGSDVTNSIGTQPDASTLCDPVSDVLQVRAEEQVSRVAARRVVAPVADMQPVRNGPTVCQLPGDSVSPDVAPLGTLHPQESVTGVVHRPGPHPAAIRTRRPIQVRVKPLLQRRALRCPRVERTLDRSTLPAPLVVASAKAACQHRLIAGVYCARLTPRLQNLDRRIDRQASTHAVVVRVAQVTPVCRSRAIGTFTFCHDPIMATIATRRT